MKPVVLLIIFSLSCASDRQAEFKGMDRVGTDETRPNFYLDGFKPKRNNRSPASITTLPSLSNRQIYFLSFYKQYLSLKKTLGEKVELNNCPSFHQVILEYKNELLNHNDEYHTKIEFAQVKADRDSLPFHPVLAIPSEGNQNLYAKMNARDWSNQQQTLREALTHYQTEMDKELHHLCETGVSSGYYVYENLVTYFKENQGFHHTKAGLKALLKVPTLANMVILDNLSRESYHKVTQGVFDTWLLGRANTAWFMQYRNYVKANRSRLLSRQQGNIK